MRRPGFWWLIRKSDRSLALMMIVAPGDQPYYVARHGGFATKDDSYEAVAYGIGKKLAGTRQTMRLWILIDGTVVGGDDVDEFNVMIAHELHRRDIAARAAPS